MQTIKIVVFKLGEEEYGLNIDYIQSIECIQPITRVPNVPHYVEGVINMRGNVTPIIDLQKKLNIRETQYTDHTRVIMTKYEDIELGLIVDQTNDVVDVTPDVIETGSLQDVDADFFAGVANIENRLIILLRLEELMKTAAHSPKLSVDLVP